MNCEGYKRLLAAVEHDEAEHPKFHDYRAKLKWAVDQASHYADKTGMKAEDILDAWEKDRNYWYMNYYQPANQPMIIGPNVRVFETIKELHDSIGVAGFRCPACNGVSKNAYTCDSGKRIKRKVCDWKVYGLFRDLGKGVTVIVKEKMAMERLFMPIAWENKPEVKP